MGCRWTSGIHRVPLDRSIDRAHLSIPTVRTVRGCDNPLEIGAIAMGRIPCSAHGGKNRGWRGAEYYYIRPPRCTYVRTYVRTLACSVSRGRWSGGWRAGDARVQLPNQAGPTSSFAVPQPGIYRGEQIVGEAFSLLS